MKNQAIRPTDYSLNDQQLSNLASEFYCHILYPAGSLGQGIAYVSFASSPEDQREENKSSFFRALSCFRLQS